MLHPTLAQEAAHALAAWEGFQRRKGQQLPDGWASLRALVESAARQPDTAPQPAPAPDWMGLDEAAAYVGVSTSTLYRARRDGRLEAHQVGSRIRVARDDLDAFIGQPRSSVGQDRSIEPEGSTAPPAVGTVARHATPTEP